MEEMRLSNPIELCADCCTAEVLGCFESMSEERAVQVQDAFTRWQLDHPGEFFAPDYDPESESDSGVRDGDGTCRVCGLTASGETWGTWYRFTLSTYSAWSNISK